MRPDLAGKRALVTGAGTGIGRATALALAAAGADVAVHCSRSRPAAEEVAEGIRAMGRRAVVLQADLRPPEAGPALAADAEERLGPIDVLVNNAAMVEADIDRSDRADFLEVAKQWDDVLNLNLRAPFLLAAALAPGMKSRGGGAVVNVASVAGMYALVDAPLYSLSKAGLLHATRQLALRFAPEVRVNAVAPGWTRTGFGTGHILDPEFQRQVAKNVPLRRLAEPEEIADAIVHLAGAAPYVTGSVLVLDGGIVAELR